MCTKTSGMGLAAMCAVAAVGLVAAIASPQTPDQGPEQAKIEAAGLILGDLREIGRVHFSAPQVLMMDPQTRCDQRGDMYLACSDTRADPESMPIQRLSLDSIAVLRYTPPLITGYATQIRVNWDVTPWGVVYALLRVFHQSPPPVHESPEYFIAKFKEDGTVDSTIHLEQPKDGSVHAHAFAAFARGGFLAGGYILTDPANPGTRRPFTGVYRQDGQLFREVEHGDFVKTASSGKGGADGNVQEGASPGEALKAVWAVMQGIMVPALDGNVYSLLTSDPPVLCEVSASGEVLKKVKVQMESTGLTPVFMSLPARGGAFIGFSRLPTGNPAEDNKHQAILALVDLETGKVTAAFRHPGEGRVMPSACVTPQNQILFLGASDDGKLDLVKYAIP